MFTTGSGYFRNASSMALKGSISIDGPGGKESGDFSAYLTGRDSVFFLIEGPFNVDLFRMIIIGDDSYFRSRNEDYWQNFSADEPLTMEEYGIYDLVPTSLAVYLFPQYFLSKSSDDERGIVLRSKRDGSTFTAFPGVAGKSVILTEDGSNLTATYKNPKKTERGYYPSEIKIFDDNRNWRISVNIEKIKVNSRIPSKIWDLTS